MAGDSVKADVRAATAPIRGTALVIEEARAPHEELNSQQVVAMLAEDESLSEDQAGTSKHSRKDRKAKEELIRGHRRKSVLLTDAELLEVRARQRTFEGAYWRTGLASFSTGLLVLKLFTLSFYRIGITFFVFGFAMLVIAVLRRRNSGDIFDLEVPFWTSGGWVVLTGAVTLGCYIAFLVLLYQL
ncbi:hypothetical protein BZG36_04425 [Bifiguratus adelaidae]|uniref:DUF202 domain-containing protein n=1 Tax=Bifiguratus adelaidae TaxID=1938954 RepID=A0A261XWP9_9FUNG|nr:hypothetical protein BZG36_04425 [Bifiguratus adelaidae]